MSRLPTLRDIALHARVDLSTVSRILRQDPRLSVRAETRERVLRIATQLNYQPNTVARSLKLRRTFTVGMLLPDVGNPVFAEIIKGAEQGALEDGYFLLLCHIDETSASEHLPLRLIQQNRVDGLLLATAQTKDAVIAGLAQVETPFVLINRRAEGMQRYVIVDDLAGARMAVRHLTGLGHQRIAHLAGPLTTDTALRRLQGYRLGLEDQQLSYDNSLVEECGFTREGGIDGMRRLLARSERPTAVVAANLLVAAGAMAVLREAGRRVPEDTSIIGLHDAPLAEMMNPPLTTIRFPLHEMGYQAAKALLRFIEGSGDPVHLVLPPVGLVARGSTTAPGSR